MTGSDDTGRVEISPRVVVDQVRPLGTAPAVRYDVYDPDNVVRSAAGQPIFVWAPRARLKVGQGNRVSLTCPIKSLKRINCGTSGAVRSGMVRTVSLVFSEKDPGRRGALLMLASMLELSRRDRSLEDPLRPVLARLSEACGIAAPEAAWPAEMNHLLPREGDRGPEDGHGMSAVIEAIRRAQRITESFVPVALQASYSPQASAPSAREFRQVFSQAAHGGVLRETLKPSLNAISDEDLTRLVWSKPLTEIAERVGLSHTAVRKSCRRRGIAMPPSSYWNLLRLGHDPLDILAKAGVEPPANVPLRSLG